ncbi:MAG: hypothetical protein M3327_09045 [Actinomycetota bacterium]|nr:hypothetical protein [Actinomycetota bacterium]
MRFYPEVAGHRAATIATDAVVLALLALFAWLGVEVHDAITQLAPLGQGVQDAGNAVRGGFEAAAGAVEGTPLVGGDIAEALRTAGEGTGGNAADLGRQGEDAVYRTANLLGILTFAVPATLLLVQALPPRVALVRRLTAADRALADPLGDRRRLLAMRAAFSLPYATLLRYTADPLGDLAAGRYDALVDAAYEDAGLRPRY